MMRVLPLVLMLATAGCATIGDRPAHRYYVLEPQPASATVPLSIAPVATSAASFYDTQDVIYSRSAGARGYYQFNHWTERPQRVVHAQLAARYRSSREGCVLATHVLEMYHDAAVAPGTSRITLAAEVLEPRRRTVLARRTFTRSAPASSHDAPGAVAGFDQALATLLDEVVAWANAEADMGCAR